MMWFIDIHHKKTDYAEALKFLYNLLKQRKEYENLSHVDMPTWEQHVMFVDSKPYRDWYIIVVDDVKVGAAYLSKNNEIGLFILEEHQGQGIGKEALNRLITLKSCYSPLYANINDKNKKSIEFFKKAGFVFYRSFSISCARTQNTYIKTV